MRLPAVPDPRDVVADLVSLVPRTLRLIAGAEEVLDRVRVVVQRVEDTRADAGAVIERVDATAMRADGIVVRLEPSVVALLPALEQLAGSLTAAEVAALMRLVDLVPGLADKVDTALPVLAGLESVSPDLKDLLDASRELNDLLMHLPGMGRARKKLEEEADDAVAAG